MRLSLTDEQKIAATTSAARAYIEASPGAGKTTVAAERYGVARFGDSEVGRGVMAVSFARSARGELQQRVRRRWGIDAMRWPHKVWTLDLLHCAIVQHLLRSKAVEWPGGHTEVTVVDSWRGHTGSWPRPVGSYIRSVSLNAGKVVVGGRTAPTAGSYFTSANPYRNQLGDGLCTHDEIRQVLAAAIAQGSPLRSNVSDFLLHTIKSLIVDEVFDGNLVDLRIVALAAEAGVPTTLIGDPWQALYSFRGAQPQLVPQLLTGLGFATFPISHSFRFESPEMQTLAAALRSGYPAALTAGTAAECDVVLASEWSRLWAMSDDVLPFSFGQASNRIDAAIALLLDQVVRGRFDALSTFGPDAAVILGLDPEVIRMDGASALAPVLETLAGATQQDATAAIGQLRDALIAMGSRPIPALQAANQAIRVDRLVALARRLGYGHLIPGLTVHQAKGREWPRVGVALVDSELARLATGLSQSAEADRRLYVALTRAKQTARLLVA